MGDRCYLRMYFRRQDLYTVAGAFDVLSLAQDSEEETFNLIFDERDITENIVDGVCYEANYGWYTERQVIASLGVPFFGFHHEGGEYPAAVFAAINGLSADVPAFDGIPYVPFNQNRAYDSTVEAEAMRYWDAYEQVHLLFFNKPLPNIRPNIKNSTRKIRV